MSGVVSTAVRGGDGLGFTAVLPESLLSLSLSLYIYISTASLSLSRVKRLGYV